MRSQKQRQQSFGDGIDGLVVANEEENIFKSMGALKAELARLQQIILEQDAAKEATAEAVKESRVKFEMEIMEKADGILKAKMAEGEQRLREQQDVAKKAAEEAVAGSRAKIEMEIMEKADEILKAKLVEGERRLREAMAQEQNAWEEENEIVLQALEESLREERAKIDMEKQRMDKKKGRRVRVTIDVE